MGKSNPAKRAKNLLEGKTCRVCEYSRGSHCFLNVETKYSFSEDGTCELWQEKDKITATKTQILDGDSALLQEVAGDIIKQYVREREEKEKQKHGRKPDLEGSETTSRRKNRSRI